MSRYFMVQSWVGSHENEPDYNGQQAGERNVRSTEVVPLYDQFGNANTKAFSDEAIEARKAKLKAKPKSLMYRILPQQSTIERLEAMREELEKEFDNGIRSLEEYQLLSVALDKKLDRAFKALERATSIPCADALAHVENAYNSGKSLLKQGIAIDYSILHGGSVFSKLSDGNIFKIFAVKVLTAKRNVAKMYTVVKQIVEEGLL